MQINPQRYLDLLEDAHKIAFFDIEATGFKGDYDSCLVVSCKPYNLDPVSISIKQVGNDKRVVREASDYLSNFDCLVSYYGKGFDWNFLNTRLLKWGYFPLKKRHHIDMYYVLRAHLLTSRRSQGHYLGWLEAAEQKMGVSPNAWSEVGFKIEEHMPTMIKRCESDCIGLEELYKRTRHLIGDIKYSG